MSDVRRLWIEGPAGRLECLLRLAPTPHAAAVIAHPHPLYGGTMHNPVIFHTDRELNRAGFATLRLNFRGVGESTGTHDEARGEIEDVEAAARWLRGMVDAPLIVVGFSFGSWCALRAMRKDPQIAGMVAIGLPVRSYDFAKELAELDRPFAAVHAEDDELATPAEVAAVLRGAPLHVLPDTTHMFPHHAKEAAERVVAAARALLDTRTH